VSKAFAGEDASEAPLVVPPRAPLPAGETNYVTPRGYALLREEHHRLTVERARLEAGEASADTPRALAMATARLAALEQRLASATLVDPSKGPSDVVRFGATVTVHTEAGTRRYQIVGVDEAAAAEGRLAFVAPLARALLGKCVGDTVTVRTPRKEEELEVVAISYEA
jgi:transcription elongation factor GreB